MINLLSLTSPKQSPINLQEGSLIMFLPLILILKRLLKPKNIHPGQLMENSMTTLDLPPHPIHGRFSLINMHPGN